MRLGSSRSLDNSWWQYWLQDIRPTPGRLHSSLRITLASVVVLVAMMVLQMPFVAYALYVIFMVGRANPAITLRTGIGLLCAVSCALSIALIVVILTDNDPMARILSLAVVTFLGGMITVATSMPTLGPGWGLIFCVGIGLWENHTPADRLVKSSLWLVAAFATGIAIAVAVEYIFATRTPAVRLAEQLRIRYRALETMFRAYAGDITDSERRRAAEGISQLAAAGHVGMLELHAQIVDRDADRADLPTGVRAHITMLAELLDSSAAFGLQADSVDAEIRSRCEVIARRCGELADDLKADLRINTEKETSTPLSHLDRVESIIRWIQTTSINARGDRSALVALSSKHVPFLTPGAMWRPENVFFSLKISLCATICYVLYHAIGWPGISTCVITVMVAGLTHTGAMKQRLAFRLLGTTIGALGLGIGAEVFLFPFMDSITALVVVVGSIAFLCAWIAGGSRFGYIGMQIAFGFYLTAIEGFSAPTELATARDRLVGILLGMIVMWFVLDQVWPVRTITVLRGTVASVLRDVGRVVALIDSKFSQTDYLIESNALRDRLGKQLAMVRMLNEATEYEFGVGRDEHMHAGDKFMEISMTAVALVWNHASVLQQQGEGNVLSHPALIALRQEVAERLSSIADGLERQSALDALELAYTGDVETLSQKHQLEYSRNVIARYNEIRAVALSFKPTS